MDGFGMGGSGALFAGSRRKRPAKKKRSILRPVNLVGPDLPTLPALGFYVPYWPMVFDGLLHAGEYDWKTLSRYWKHRGPLLAYTTTGVEPIVMGAYGYSKADFPTKVIEGCVNVLDVRELTDNERAELFMGYNNAHTKKEIERAYDGYYVDGAQWGIAINRKHRFKEPVPITWPSTGSHAHVPIIEPIMDQLPKWAKEGVEGLRRAA